MLEGTIRSVFVGRQREMAQLHGALDAALSGQGRMVMLAGEPGIGKTRTATELASYAEGRGAKVLWGWCYEEEGAPPYWPWVQMIRSYVGQCEARQLQSEMGPGAANIADIVPEIHTKITHLTPPSTLEPEAARFRLFDSIASFLKNASQSQPLMLVLDDIHWADTPSLLLYQFLAREMAPNLSGRLLVMGCYRDIDLSRQHPLSETLAQLSRSSGGGFQRVLLRGLDSEDTARFIEESTKIEPTPGLAEALFAHTDGNPFFMTEVIRLLSESGELTVETIGTPEAPKIPEGVREVIGQRLNRLSQQCNDVLTTASIIGREFDFRLLSYLSIETSEDEMLRAVDEAVSFHLIEDLPGRIDCYQFSHALIQQTLTQELSTSRKVRLHARIAEALEHLYGDSTESHAAELAYHFAEAEPLLGAERLVRYSLLAGDQALAAYAFEEALFQFQRGFESGQDQSISAGSAALLFGLGRAQVALFRVEEARVSLTRAFEYYAEAGDGPSVVRVAQSLPPGGVLLGMTSMTARALEFVDSDSLDEGRLLCRHGLDLGRTDVNYEAARAALQRALSIAQREQDVALEMRTLSNIASVAGYNLQYQDSLGSALGAIELAHSGGDLYAECLSRFWAGTWFGIIGDSQAASRYSREGLESAEILRDRYRLINALWLSQRVAHSLGEWQTARELSHRTLTLAPEDGRLLALIALLEFETGEAVEGQRYLDSFLDTLSGRQVEERAIYGLVVVPAIARLTGHDQGLDDVERACKAFLSRPNVTPRAVECATVGLALIAIKNGEASESAEHYSRLQSKEGTLEFNTVLSFDRLLGLLARSMGSQDQAASHFEDSLAFCRKAGYRPELAWTCCDYADMLLDQHGEAEQVKAVTLLEESLTIATELGMPPLMERARERLTRIQTRPVASPGHPGGLTPREVEVLHLIAAGKTNREIAQELFIGVRTVDTHVSNILSKTASANKAEAASYAIRHGLF